MTLPGNSPSLLRRRRRPEGVDDALWAYATSNRLAQEESSAFASHPLCQADIRWVLDHLGAGPGLVADLGCGTGRAARALAAQGWNALAIELSQPMLAQMMLEHHSSHTTSTGFILPIQANLARLDCIPPNALDAAICLFSTWGMIRTPQSRQLFIQSVAHALKPGGRFLFHAHNLYLQLKTAQGCIWFLKNGILQLTGNSDYGNRAATSYRGLPGVMIHMFTFREIQTELAKHKLKIKSWINLDPASAQNIGPGFFKTHLLAGGWLIEAEKQ